MTCMSGTFQLPQIQEKPAYVQRLFSRLALRYDLMNDVMTMGLHRLWKKRACRLLELNPGGTVLDVCCGTGDLEFYLAKMGMDVTGLDFCAEMLDIARRRMQQAGLARLENCFVQGDAMALPFEENRFDGAIISYGLRNVSDYETCLREMRRVVKPGGRIVILDMSHPNPVMNALSTFYRFTVVPLLGKCLADDPEAYRYLTHSIYFYLSQQRLVGLMQQVGLRNVRFENKLGGVCAIHRGVK